MHRKFRRSDIVAGAVFAVLLIIGVVALGATSKQQPASISPAASATRTAVPVVAATRPAAPGPAASSPQAPPTTAAPPPPTTAAPPPPPTPSSRPAPPRTMAAAPPRTRPAAPPVPAAPPPTRPAAPVAAAPAPATCTPKTDAGNCYEPGEFCRDSDHGVTGVAGDGKAIECEDNDGWRWEPA